MNKHAGNLRNDNRAWIEVPADDNGDAMIAAQQAVPNFSISESLAVLVGASVVVGLLEKAQPDQPA